MSDEPFHVGDRAARLELDEHETVRVHSTTITAVEQVEGRWQVTDDQGQLHEFDSAGESPQLLPLDPEIEQDLRTQGEGYEARIEERSLGWDTIEIEEPEITEHEIEGPGHDL